MIKKILIPIAIILFLTACKAIKPYKYSTLNPIVLQKQDSLFLKGWFLKDINQDTIPGISLTKAKNSVLKNRINRELIVAVIDGQVDINHTSLKSYIWVNQDEISNNGKDDDANGYIDDIHGWNFIGNHKNNNIIHANTEEVRIVRHCNNLIKKATIKDTLILLGDELYQEYNLAKQTIRKERRTSESVLKQSSSILEKYKSAYSKVAPYILHDSTFTTPFLKKLKEEKISLKKEIDFLLLTKQVGIENLKGLENDIQYHKNRLNKYFNIDYNEKDSFDHFSNDITYTNYGNNNVSNYSKQLYHGTIVTGVLTQILPENIKIMPLPISPNGDEHDKDIALAIKYAVNNGAKVINMSFGKDLSLHKEWVFDAIKYAEEHEVLIITSAGNDSKNLDLLEISNYPNDTKSNVEFVSNFIKVGYSSIYINEKLKNEYSNYGKKEVDIFAPGTDIYTTSVNGSHKHRSGSSYSAPMVSGIAALLFSYYPNLRVSQVKHIIMDSGVEYTFPVKVPIAGTKKDTLIPFNQLSKSGKIVNAYNALIMADSISKVQSGFTAKY